MNKNYKVITLCGSTKFKEEFMNVQKDLTLKVISSQGDFVESYGNVESKEAMLSNINAKYDVLYSSLAKERDRTR